MAAISAIKVSPAPRTPSSFLNILEPGAVLHLHESFGKYVRGRVVATPKGNRFLPTALVGAWEAADLPAYNPVGEVIAPFQAKRILEQTLSSLGITSNHYYESPDFTGPCGPAASFDPRGAPALNLTPPPPTLEQNREFAIERLRQGAIRVLRETPHPAAAMSAAQQVFFPTKVQSREF